MDKFLLGLLVVIGIIGMIDVSSGLKCYQCMQAPGQDPKYNTGGCTSTDAEPPADENKECTGEHSQAVKDGIKEVKEKQGVDLDDTIKGFEEDGVPTCILAYGKYNNDQYIVRDCAKLTPNLILGQCRTFPDQKLKDGNITEINVCGCNVDGCNGKTETAKLTVAPTEATTPEKTNKPQTTDNSDNTDGTTMMTPSATTFILGAIFFVYAKLFY